MTDTASTRPAPVSRGRILLEFLGSMNLAITLLVAVAVASVIGTVLQQNQPYQDYLIKFGPFWFEVFGKLGLYDVYSTGWFLFILGFLVVSTSVCIYRNVPAMLHDMRSYRLGVQRRSLQAFHLKREWTSGHEPQALEDWLARLLKSAGYRFRSRRDDDHLVLAARKGAWSRLGYLFTHAAIVIICVGALFDGNIPLKLRVASGDLKVETRDIPASEVPAISRLPVDNPSFRGSVRIAEGTSANVVFLQLGEGYLVQPLPFRIEVKDFRIEHYATGQPKSFESDIVIHDPQREQPLEATISVNHPLIYRGYAIYQASFSDGGTGLTLDAWLLRGTSTEPMRIQGRVFESVEVQTPDGPMTLEFTDFRLFNINPVKGPDGKVEQKNFGPNFTYKLRDATGQAREYENYMLPVTFDGRPYFLSGVRESPAEPYRYLHIPATPDGSIRRFQRFNALLWDDERVEAVARRTTRAAFAASRQGDAVAEDVVASMRRLVSHFRSDGFDGIAEQVRLNVPEDKQAEVIGAYMKVLQAILGELYLQVLEDEGISPDKGLDEAEERFFDDAVNAISALKAYGSPFYLQLKDYDFVQATGLQIARAPGKNVVYLGFGLLIAGVFLMFYVPYRRLWIWIDRDGGRTRVLMAGSGSRHQQDFETEFDRLAERIEAQIGPPA